MDQDMHDRVFPRYASYKTLFQRHRGRIDPRLALDILRDPYPRESQGERYRRPGPGTTICRAATSFSLIMQPGLGVIWGSDGELPAPQGSFYAFNQRDWERLPDLDFASSGFRPALACAEEYLQGDIDAAWARLNHALDADGETAPLLTMRAVLRHALGDFGAYETDLRYLLQRWGETAIGAIAQAWLNHQHAPLPPFPFPSAIAPRLGFYAVADVRQRVRVWE
jgi:hypothetical protein